MATNDKWFTATLRIHSRTMSAQEISDVLETAPTSTAEKGAHMSSRNLKSAIFEEHLWLLESEVDSAEPLEAHITNLVEFIERKLHALEVLINSCELDIFCGYSSDNGQGGFVLKAELLKRLTVLPVDIMLDP